METKSFLITKNGEPQLIVYGNSYMAEGWRSDLAFSDYHEISGSEEAMGPLYELYEAENKWEFAEVPWTKAVSTGDSFDDEELKNGQKG